MMKNTAETNQKNIWSLVVASIATSVLFSFLSAPFLRVLAVSGRSKIFWTTGILLIVLLFTLNWSLAAIYVGAIWMTLGSYSEFERRGINWRWSGLLSLFLGLSFACVSYFVIVKASQTELLDEVVQPFAAAIKKSFPDSTIESNTLIGYVPGVLLSSLLIAMAMGFILEPQIVRLFQLRHTKVASGLRWLEFRLPDIFVWVAMFAALFSMENFGIAALKTISVNLIIFSAVAFFLQGLTVAEFSFRVFRFGPFSKTIMYILILLQLAPGVAFIGFIDYWVDFRKRMRRKIKLNQSK